VDGIEGTVVGERERLGGDVWQVPMLFIPAAKTRSHALEHGQDLVKGWIFQREFSKTKSYSEYDTRSNGHNLFIPRCVPEWDILIDRSLLYVGCASEMRGL
jgi:hypothetical protein